jgi:hypothetical protein
MYDNNYLSHFGIKGQRWGVRRFQNSDGSLNAAGKRNAAKGERKEIKKELHKVNKTKTRSWLTPSSDGSRSDAIHRQRKIVNRASKYVQKHGMSLEDALSASRATGRKNGAALVAGAMAITLGSIYIGAKGG